MPDTCNQKKWLHSEGRTVKQMLPYVPYKSNRKTED